MAFAAAFAPRSAAPRAVCSQRPNRALRVAAISTEQKQHPAIQATSAAKLGAVAAAAAVLLSSGGALAREQVAEFATSGLIFKDTVKVIELDDDQVDGIAIYLTDYNRSITERLAKDPFSDPSQASLTCVATKPVTIKDVAAVSGSEGKEVFKERKGLNLFQNKNLRIRRIYDDKNKVVIYVAFSTRFTGATEEKELSTSRYRTSVCAVPVAAPALVEAADPTLAE